MYYVTITNKFIFTHLTPLLSRCQVYVLKSLDVDDLKKLSNSVLNWYRGNGFGIEIDESEALFHVSGGDARKLINAIELVFMAEYCENQTLHITNSMVQEVIQKRLAIYDKNGEQHYDIISAFIKSIRGSDPNAAIYWLARMIEGGEDPKFIARRLVILASEDIGNANPNGLLLANACFDAISNIGMPEGRIVLAQTVVYLACSQKTNASYMAIEEAIEMVNQTGDLPVPLHIRNAPTKLMKDLGYHKGYQYDHNYQNNFSSQEFLPKELSGHKFYDPGNNARENEMRQRLKILWKDKYGY